MLDILIGYIICLTRRGIPCGISFPKDYCSTIPSRCADFESENEQPPVQQRHTYFQGNSGCPPLKPLRRFNRATKPPARYKNGRMALRLRHRPVLCSKCKAYCEEKNPSKNSDELGENWDNQKGSGTSTRRGTEPKSKSYEKKSQDSVFLESSASNTTEEQEDYTFTVANPMGGGVVENYWKRPTLTVPIQVEKIRLSGNPEEKEILETEDAEDTLKSFMSLKLVDSNKFQSPATAEQPKVENSDTFQSKKKNLRLCINKLRIQKKSRLANENHSGTIGPMSQNEAGTFTENYSVGIEPSSAGKIRMRKRSTTVPARFRDEACLTKNFNDLKKKHKGTKVSGLEATEQNPLPAPTPNPVGLTASGEGLEEEQPEIVSGDHFLVGNRKILSSNTKAEVSRTPTIKISYGSSGKGVVLEIPSKPTIESSPEDSLTSAKSKAEKRALRKARKQAKRKLSKESASMDTAASNSLEFSSSQSSCSSPPPPLLTPISELCSSVAEEDFPISLDHCPPLIHFTKEIPLTPKKRKKEKKQKYKGQEGDKPPLVS